MEIIIQPTPEAAIRLAARMIAGLLQRKPNAVLGLATGSTPLPLYRELSEMPLDWRQVTTFNLDEYLGLPPDHEKSFHYYMRENLFKHVNIPPANTHIPDGLTSDVPSHCADYDERIRKAGGIDLQLLGIGVDGHIGFNEPTSSLASRTRIKTIAPQTRKDNARFFGSEERVPRHCITMGIGTILEARQCLLLAFGTAKARIVAETVEGPLAANNPASALQMHPNAIFCVDEKAAQLLKRSVYYRWVYDNKPAWQKFR
jgi:glucosamine-6-phosphate deaminase